VKKPSSTIRRQALAERIAQDGDKAMVACSACAVSRTLCLFAPHSLKCSECVHKNVSYDGSFSEADYDKLSEEQSKLEAARSKATAEILWLAAESASLDRRVEALKKAKGEMISREARALEELEREEQRARQANEALPEFVFDEQQLAALLGSPSDSFGGNPQGS
jgi:hypothetical protein